MQKTKKKRDACERDKKERPLVASYQFTRCLWVDPAAPFCARLDDLKVSLSLRKSWRCCCFEWGHNATTFSFFFTRYFLFFFYLNVVETRAMLPLSLSPIFAASSCVEGVCVLAKKKNWINIHQGGWMLSINRITLVKERDKSRELIGIGGWLSFSR